MSATAMPGTPRRSMFGVLWTVLQAGCLTALAAITAGFIVFVQGLDRIETVPPRRAAGIVALTGGADRVADALELLVGGRADRLLISGVNPTTSGLDLTRAVPEARRLLDCCIELGYAAGNTVGNARETRAWVRRYGLRSLIVVTSNYHMPRALAEIADAAPNVELIAYPVVSDRAEEGGHLADAQRLRLLVTEYCKYLVVLVRTHMVPTALYGGDSSA